MHPCKFLAKTTSRVQEKVDGFKCLEFQCPVVYSRSLGGYCNVDPTGTPTRLSAQPVEEDEFFAMTCIEPQPVLTTHA